MSEAQDTSSLMDSMMEEIMALPRKGTPVAELTDRDKMALYIAAGGRVVSKLDGPASHFTYTSECPFGVADRGDGGYIVAIGPKP